MVYSNIALLIVLIATIGQSLSLPIAQNASVGPDNNGDMSFLDYVHISELYLSCKPLCAPAEKTNVKFFLYTRRNPTLEQRQEIQPDDGESIKKSNFNYRKQTRFVVHGWNNNFESSVNRLITEAYLHKDDYNVIVVDWSSCAKTINYFAARCCVENVGKQVALLIDNLNKAHRLKFKDVKLIGHSLGAHVCGFAGKNVSNGKIKTIIGLDPAMPCFKVDAHHERLSASDAEFVETIHTNAGVLGFLQPVGMASFYPNGGVRQPGCRKISCSHGRSFEYYAESVERVNQFIPKKCNSLNELREQKCSTEAQNIRMGGEKLKSESAKGIYFLPTNSEYPFAIGHV